VRKKETKEGIARRKTTVKQEGRRSASRRKK
jgi:hypothetical protein